MKTWLKGQSTAVLSSIKQAPDVRDVQTFVSVAESEGLPFFSNTCVLVDGPTGRIVDLKDFPGS